MNLTGITDALGLSERDREYVSRLTSQMAAHERNNSKRRRYYEEKIGAREVNLGIAVPDRLANVQLHCSWARKAVDVLADRSQFDGFVSSTGDDISRLSALVQKNALVARYCKALRAELYHGVNFATISGGNTFIGEPSAVVRFHSAETASAIWDGRTGRIEAGLAIVGLKANIPVRCALYTDTDIVLLDRDEKNLTKWTADYNPHFVGRPLMEPFAYCADEMHPFGRSRVTDTVMSLVDSYLRECLRMEIAAELFTSPQKVILGADDNDFDMDKVSAYMSSILLIGRDGESGEVPQLMQLSASSMQPHIEVMRSLAAQFSGATNIPLSELGIIHDNPASAEAIYASNEPLVIDAQNLNADNGTSLVNVALMLQAIDSHTSIDMLTEEQTGIIPIFKNPARPTIVSQADAVTKIASVSEGFAGSPVFFEEIGFTQDQIQRLEAWKRTQAATQSVASIFQQALNENSKPKAGDNE